MKRKPSASDFWPTPEAFESIGLTGAASAVRRALVRAERARQVEGLIETTAVEFDHERPGYETEPEGDNFHEAAYDHIAGRLVAAGGDLSEYEAQIDAAIEWVHDGSNMATQVACQGGGGREECEIAAAYLNEVERVESTPRAPRTLSIFAPDIVDASLVWARVTGRAPRLACNAKRKGSRRTTADDDPDLPHEHLAAFGRSYPRGVAW